jgi:long-chain fatty acid transport protein
MGNAKCNASKGGEVAMRTIWNAKIAGASLAWTLAAVVGQAHGAAFQLMEQNASGLGNAYSGQAAAAEDASTVWFNPAGMVRLPGRQVVGALNLIRPSAKFTDDGSTLPTGFPGPRGGDGGEAGGWNAVPNAYLSWELRPGTMWAGLGINAPFGLKTEWDSAWVGRFQAVKSEVRSVNVNPALAWRVGDRLALGVGLNAMRFDAELSNAARLGPATERMATVKGDDWAYGWNAGVLWDLTPAMRAALTYRSSISVKLEGDATFDRAPALNAPVRSDIKLPDTLSLALSHQLTSRLQVLADWTRTGWDGIQDLVISNANTGATLSTTALAFRDSWRVGVGANYQVNSAWKIRAGFAYDKSPVQDSHRTPRLPDDDRRWVALGAQYTASSRLAFDVGYAHLFVSDTPSNLTDNPVSRGTLIGSYRSNVNILAAQVRYSF